MWNEMSWDRMPGTGTEVPTIGEFLAGNPVPHLVPHDMSVTSGVLHWCQLVSHMPASPKAETENSSAGM